MQVNASINVNEIYPLTELDKSFFIKMLFTNNKLKCDPINIPYPFKEKFEMIFSKPGHAVEIELNMYKEKILIGKGSFILTLNTLNNKQTSFKKLIVIPIFEPVRKKVFSENYTYSSFRIMIEFDFKIIQLNEINKSSSMTRIRNINNKKVVMNESLSEVKIDKVLNEEQNQKTMKKLNLNQLLNVGSSSSIKIINDNLGNYEEDNFPRSISASYLPQAQTQINSNSQSNFICSPTQSMMLYSKRVVSSNDLSKIFIDKVNKIESKVLPVNLDLAYEKTLRKKDLLFKPIKLLKSEKNENLLPSPKANINANTSQEINSRLQKEDTKKKKIGIQ